MNTNWKIVGDKIFGILKGTGFRLQMFDQGGTKTLDPHEATRFFATIGSNDPDLKEYSILISVHDENANSHIDIKTPNLKDPKDFEFMRKITQNMKTNVGNREGISINWMKFDHAIKPRDSAIDNITESKDISKPFGSTKSSYQRIGDSKLIIRHTDSIDEEKIGSRWRQVKAIFIENRIGERFLYPHMHIAGARAMARHMSNNGTMHDEIGEAIQKLSGDYTDLKRGSRMLKTAGDESMTTGLREALHGINKQVKRLCGPRGYSTLSSTLTEKTEMDEARINEIHADLVERCGCQQDDEGKRVLSVASRYLSSKPLVEDDLVEFTRDPDLVSRAGEFTDQKQRLAWQVREMAECVADPEMAARLHGMGDTLDAGGILNPEDIDTIRVVYKASKGLKHEPEVNPDLARIRELSGL